MWSFEIRNIKTDIYSLIFGYTYQDALKRAGLDGANYEYIAQTYED